MGKHLLRSLWVVACLGLAGWPGVAWAEPDADAGADRGAVFQADWGPGVRTWVGPEWFAIRWQDWSVGDPRAAAGDAAQDDATGQHPASASGDGPRDGGGSALWVEGRPGRSCVVMTREVAAGDGELVLQAQLRGEAGLVVPAGFWVGVRGPVAGQWRSDAAYGDYHAFAGVRPDGTLVLRDADFQRQTTADSALDPTRPMMLRLSVQVRGESADLTLRITQDQTSAEASLALSARDVQGLVGMGTADLLGKPPGADPRVPRWCFGSFSARGPQLTAHEQRTFGPIGWTQYTHVGDVLKLTALVMPVDPESAGPVQLLLEREDPRPAREGQPDEASRWEPLAEAEIESLSRCATFRVEEVTVDRPRRYRVAMDWRGRRYTFDGTLRPPPTEAMKIAVMSCDWGYAFPNAPLVSAVAERDPDLLVYAGDQIYEFFGKFNAEHEPLDRSALDYLRKYALFGWINRDLLRDRPSVIIPDDHDVFQGNIWGAGGAERPPRVNLPGGGYRGGDPMGGYRQPVAWINAMQRSQTWHLPDPADPAPAQRGIGVYFGGFEWGGVRFAVLEDRKWKTGYRQIWETDAQIPVGDHDALDPPGTELLGPRQEAFLENWAEQNPGQIHVAISQTMFAKAHTHTGPNLRPIAEDFDTNGWPRTPRNRAVALLGQARALHLAGDQHLGILAQLGVTTWDDGPLAFMVPGTTNGWPRAWWPTPPQADGDTPSPESYTGRFTDEFGNQMTILAVANPEPGSNLLRPAQDGPYRVARARGSGFGLVTLDLTRQIATLEMLRFPAVDPDSTDDVTAKETDVPAPRADAFPGFPQRFELDDDGWQPLAP